MSQRQGPGGSRVAISQRPGLEGSAPLAEGRQGSGHFAGRLHTLLGTLGQHAKQHLPRPVRHIATKFFDRPRRIHLMLEQFLDVAAADKWRLPGQ